MGDRFCRFYRFLIEFIQKYYRPLFVAAGLTLAVFCFYRLDVKYVDSWDEARHGVNAYEMIQNQDFIRHTYNYEVDDWNLKPSLSYWGILAGFLLFGYNVFALRFYSAAAYLLTGIACGLFVGRRSRTGGILVMGFFCANTLPLYAHLARAGDADSLYLLLFTISMLSMLYIPKNKKCLYLCGLCFSLAFLTKSWHAGMIAVIGGLYLLITREICRVRLKEWGIFLGCILAPLVLWFGWRYRADGFDFLKQMIRVDLLARTGSENFEGHSFPFSFYWETVFGNGDYIYPWIVGICGVGIVAAFLIWAFRKEKKRIDKERLQELLGLILWFCVVFFGFSLMGTKLIWYCYPAIVPLFMIAALLLGKFLEAGVKGSPRRKEGQEEQAALEIPGKAVRAGNQGRVGRLEEAGNPQKAGCVGGNRKRVFLTVGQFLLAVGCIVLNIYFMRFTYNTVIRDAKEDDFQDFIRVSVSQSSPYAGRDAYLAVAGEHPERIGEWDQNRLFLAEISGNFRCKDGGLEAFWESDRASVLFLTLEDYLAHEEQMEEWGCQQLWRDREHPYVLVGKQRR